MDLRKAKVNGRMSDIISFESLHEHRNVYHDTNSQAPVAVECIKQNGETYYLPYYAGGSTNTTRPGVYPVDINHNIDFIVYPEKEEAYKYQPERIADFRNIKNIQQYLEVQKEAEEMSNDIVSNPDNIFTPPLLENDSPEMRGLKEAIIAKKIDIDKYQDNFGDNFPNDKRKLYDNKITLFLLKRDCECLDMKAELVISDANPNVPNPLGKEIHIQITSDKSTSEE